MIWQSQEFDLTVEEAEEYAAQIGSLIAISEVYGGLPSGGNVGEILIKNSGEDYDAIWGTIKNGANIWWTDHLITQGDTAIYTAKRYVIGRTDMQPEIHDFLVGQDIEMTEGTPNTLYEIIDINQLVYNLKRIGNIGENDYNKLLNKPQIDGIEINKNSTSIGLGLATASALDEKYTKPSNGIPASDLADDVHLIPPSGTIGQVLRKISDNDWDINWDTINDGEDGSGVWYTTDRISGGQNPFVGRRSLVGREGATVQAHDLLFAPDVGYDGEPTTLYEITSAGIACTLNRLCKMQGEPGDDGVGVPSGGTTGQILKKQSGTDYDTEWVNESGGAFIVTITYSDDTYSADKTFTQIESALQAGMEVSVIYESSWYKLTFITESPSFALFSRINGTETDTFYLDDQGNVSRTVTALGTYSKPSGGIPASDLANDVHLIPSGGTIGQVLRKISDNDWDIEWDTVNDGEDGNQIWWTRAYISPSPLIVADVTYMSGGTASPKSGDYVIGSPPDSSGNPTFLYSIDEVSGNVAFLIQIGSLKGIDGVGVPSGGTTGQVLKKVSGTDYDTEWADESSGISDYSDLTNKPQISSVTLSGNKSLSDLGIEPEAFVVTITNSGGSYLADKTYTQITAAASAGKRVVATIDDVYFSYYGLVFGADALFYNTKQLTNSFWSISSSDVLTHYTSTAGTYSKPVSGIPATDLASGVIPTVPNAYTSNPEALGTASSGSSTSWAKGDHVHPMPSASDVGADPAALIVTFTSNLGGTITADHTYTEIGEAVSAGKRVIAVLDDFEYQLFSARTNLYEPIVFSGASGTYAHTISIAYGDVITIETPIIGTYSKPTGGIPKTDLASAVQSSLDKADTALQSFTETDPTVPSWAKASNKPSYSASEVGAVAVAQGVAHAGEFVVVGSDGNITTVTMSVWQGGSY